MHSLYITGQFACVLPTIPAELPMPISGTALNGQHVVHAEALVCTLADDYVIVSFFGAESP